MAAGLKMARAFAFCTEGKTSKYRVDTPTRDKDSITRIRIHMLIELMYILLLQGKICTSKC